MMEEKGTVSLRGVRAALVVLEEGSVSRAAPALFISQPALSRLIKVTEERLGVELFERRPDGIVPHTQAGSIFDRFRRIRQQLKQASQELSFLPEMQGTEVPFYRHAALRHLRALVATGDSGSATAAAAMLGHSTTAVARAIRDVEELVGLPLFERRPGRMVLTKAGALLVRQAKLVLHELRYVCEEMEARSGTLTGRVAIGSMPLARSFLIPEALSRLSQTHPELRFSIVEGPYSTLLDGLHCGDLDVVVGALREPAPAKNVQEDVLYRTPLSIVVRRGHPLAGRSHIGMEDLNRASWVVPVKGTPARAKFEMLFRQAKLPPPTAVVECSSSIATRELLLRNDWIAIVTRQQIHFEEQFGILEVLPIELPGTARSIGFSVRADMSLPPASAAFIESLRAVSDQLIRKENEAERSARLS
ncbi:LysR family transcriptional regulator [Marinobacter sp. M5B]|uniref:LysR family transcriptional regulator n=1 Tax=Marinobacter sp. M5B TaxID=3141535 RepID=UPI0036D26A02